MNPHPDVAVVGGGVIGLTSAWFLANEGLRVVVLDQGEFGAEASWAGAGILPPSSWARARTPFDKLRAFGSERIADFSQELRDRTGIDNGFRRSGGIVFDRTAGEASAEEWFGQGVPSSRIDEASSRKLEPALGPNLGDALHLPTMAQLRNPRHLRALEALCRSSDRIDLRSKTPVRRIRTEGRGMVVEIADADLRAGSVLAAAGAWSGAFLAEHGLTIPIKPIRGQIALVHPGKPLLKHVLAWGPRYLVPREEGRILVGSTEENVGFDRSTTDEAIDGLIAFGRRMIPALESAPLEHRWAGLRPGIADGLPVIGPIPGLERAFVASGHFRAGVQLSLGTAQAVADLVLGRASELPLKAFRPDRFAKP